MEYKYKDTISVVVPIYNVEKYLEKCINSILNQTYDNLEIILVDDGSPDKSPDICDSYSKKDKRIKVIHKLNGGLSDARNVGIDQANGKYITFIDSDDYIDNDYIEFLFINMEKEQADIAICNPRIVYENFDKEKNISKFRINKVQKISSQRALEIMLYQKKFDTSAWGKLYKTELFTNVRYPIGKYYEDIATTYKLFLKSTNIVYSDECKYNYLQRKSSIMGQPFKITDFDYIENANIMLNDLKDNKVLYKAAKSRYISANFSILKKIIFKKEFNDYVINIKENIKDYRLEVLFDCKSRLKNKVAILLSIFI